MNKLKTNNQLVPVQENENGEVVVSGRMLHKALEVKTQYKDWFPRMTEYGFVEGEDFNPLKIEQVRLEGSRRVSRQVTDHIIKLDMAKEISMIQRSEPGKKARQYFIQVEKAWNSPEMIMKRALQIADKKIISLEEQIKLDKPKTIFADAVAASKTSILVGELAKLLKQNGVEIGQKRLFAYLRENGFLIKRKGTDYNMPTQYSMERGLFEIKETSITHSDGHVSINKTPKVTGKGQQYFINKFLNSEVR
ncbi:oxidoreductase [Macrococcoides caseolyticum subsp. caseolyticum]|uniref:phage antirepressor KilAC domain-containing protein n=1 Tax=Macrococcoides caseolyticum TaxID=69966 RepID=UPI000CD00A72|nr:phage antirepressor KilAC domain-containing protein [Macrococcus caseolyticus]PNZ72091.1 oxidoreductase [Macrococcus caseolyticus]QPT45695.1 phage antirepressor KilAC domain-containing protein [Macrococcus caseolyticus]RAK47600.1 oxidoreductase [Macrococcus caseolyticus subsp. caseolyticus]HCD19436.1 oxidoreductase [Macrococcus caseolyticus]